MPTNPLDLFLGTEDPGVSTPDGAPLPAPQVAQTPKPKGGLTALLPIIAAFVAAKQGGLPGYAQGLYTSEQNRREQADREAVRTTEQARYEQSNQRANAALDLQRQSAERQAMQDQQRQQDQQLTLISERVETAFQNNPTLEEQVNQLGPESFSLQIPGLGNLNLRQAFDRIGVLRGPDGKYHVGGKPVSAAREPLITSTDDKGRPVRVPDKPGTPVYERPRAPRATPAPTTRSYTWKDDDPESETFGKSFRIVEDAQGNVIKKTPITGGIAPVASHAPAAAPAKNSDPLGIR